MLRCTVSREGWGTLLVLALFVALFAFLGFRSRDPLLLFFSLLTLLLFLLALYFFRDPHRTVPRDPGVIVSPADGLVCAIDEIEEPLFFEGRVKRVAIYLSLLDVHINYIPLSGTVEYARYFRGKHLRAGRPETSENNTRTFIGLSTERGRLAFKQIAGIVARRVICRLRMGDRVVTGAKFGMIKFGSRVELLLPPEISLNVQVGDRVRGGESVIAA